MTHRYDVLETPLGALAVVVDDDARLRHVGFLSDNAPYGKHVALDPQWKREKGRHGAALLAYFAGELTTLEALPVELEGTAFELKVWRALRTIQCGTTWSYGQLAAAIGQPKASRAVGLANGRNPVALVVPCHRVIGANGALTGYGGGVHRKAWLLAHEGARPLLSFPGAGA